MWLLFRYAQIAMTSRSNNFWSNSDSSKGGGATLLDLASHSNNVVSGGSQSCWEFCEDLLRSHLYLGSVTLYCTIAQIVQQLAFLPTSSKAGRAESERGHRGWKTKGKLLQRVLYAISMPVL